MERWKGYALAGAAAAFALVLFAPATTNAAAELAAATPAPGSEIEELPDTIVLRFTQDLTDISLEIDGEAVEADLDEETARAELPELDEGEHEITWTVTSEVDDKETSGSYSFEVVAPFEDEGPGEVNTEERSERIDEVGDDNRSQVLLWTALAIAVAGVLVFIFYFFRTSLPMIHSGIEGGLPPPGQSPPEHHEEDDEHGH